MEIKYITHTQPQYPQTRPLCTHWGSCTHWGAHTHWGILIYWGACVYLPAPSFTSCSLSIVWRKTTLTLTGQSSQHALVWKERLFPRWTQEQRNMEGEVGTQKQLPEAYSTCTALSSSQLLLPCYLSSSLLPYPPLLTSSSPPMATCPGNARNCCLLAPGEHHFLPGLPVEWKVGLLDSPRLELPLDLRL